MKRIIIGMIACICAITVMAQVQTHDVKGVVFDRRQQPIVGALVTAKGTNISTITDVDGKFLLQEVPLSVKKVVVTSIGMETREVDLNVPVQLTGKRKKVSFVAHAGLSMSKYTIYGSDFKVGYEFGLGIEVRMSKRWAFQPTLQICNHGAEFNAERYGVKYQERACVWGRMMKALKQKSTIWYLPWESLTVSDEAETDNWILNVKNRKI